MKHRFPLCATVLAVAVPLSACDSVEPDVPPSREEILEEVDFDGLEDAEDRVVAHYVDDEIDLRFIENEDPETGEPTIDVALIQSREAPDRISPLLDAGATPLELLLHVSPDAEIPEVMLNAHRVTAEAAGRDSEIRELTQFRGMTQGNDPICDSWSAFFGHVSDRFSPYDINTNALRVGDPLWTRSAVLTATTSSNKNPAVRVCNRASASGCAYDGLDAHVFRYGASGSGYEFSTTLTDCDLLKYWWGQRVAGTTYGVVVDTPWRDFLYGPQPCVSGVCAVQTDFAVGFR